MDVLNTNNKKWAQDVSFILSYLGFLLITTGMILLLIPALPWVYYRVNAEATSDEVAVITGFIGIGGNVSHTNTLPTPSVEYDNRPAKPVLGLPPFNASLSKKNTLKISKIGVNGEIHEGEDAGKQLYKGVWRVPEFGTPFANEYPIILASHRYGYIDWSADFRKKNSFANLPNLKEGDTFKIIWGQRSFVYRIYHKEENTKLTDYSADVILYTCKYLKSPIRIVIYADRIL